MQILSTVAQVELHAASAADLRQAMGTYDVVWFRLAHRIDAELLASASRCRLLVTPVTGLDHVDLAACSDRQIHVISLRGETDFLTRVRATAELTIGLTLALLRQIPAASASVLAGQWNRDDWRGREIYAKTVGLVGIGRLGSLAAAYFSALGADVIAFDPRGDFPTNLARRVDSLPDLLGQADIVSIHAAYSPATRHLLGPAEFAACKAGAILVNTSRGAIIDDQALLAALESGHLAGAALDVLEGEPDIRPDHPVLIYARTHTNLLLVPHIGGNTYESFEKTECFLAERVVSYLANQRGTATKGSRSNV